MRAFCCLAFMLLGLCRPAVADEAVEICYNYDCLARARVVYSDGQLKLVRQWLMYASNADTERKILARVMGKLYGWAGQQSPIHVDRAGDYLDDGVDGKMDCIDHATSTTRLLKVLEARGWLRFHRVVEVQRRTSALGLLQHFSAAIEEVPGGVKGARSSLRVAGPRVDVTPQPVPGGPRFVVDSWFHDNGQSAEVMPLQEWLDGGGPDV